MNGVLPEQNSLMEKIVRDYGSLIKGAVQKAMRGHPCGDDIVSEVYFAILLTLRKFGAGWTPPRSFIFAVVRNKVNDYLRQKYRQKNGIEGLRKHLAEQASQKEQVVSRIHCLTCCEFRVFRLLGMGMTNSEIAQSLHVSLYTIRSHVKKIHAKCGVRDRAKLTLIAHLVCFREQLENPEGERESREAPRPLPRGTQSLPERRHPELWEPDPSSPPVAVETWTKYFS
jgi:RNA polymerase sigma factor (sigma-70 family)